MPTTEQYQANHLTPAQLADMPDDTLVTQRDVLHMIRVSRTTLWRGINAGHYPKPVKLGPRLNRWHLGTVREFARKAI